MYVNLAQILVAHNVFNWLLSIEEKESNNHCKVYCFLPKPKTPMSDSSVNVEGKLDVLTRFKLDVCEFSSQCIKLDICEFSS